MGKKTLSIVLGLIAVFILVSFDSAKAAKKPAKVFHIRGQVAWGPGTGVWQTTVKACEMIEAYTNGRVKMNLHVPGELVGAVKEYDAVSMGSLDFGMGCTCYAINRCRACPLYCDCPASLSGTEELVWLYDYKGGEGLKILQDLFAKHFNGAKVFIHSIVSGEVWLFANTEIKSLDDVRKLKMRASGLRGDVYRKMGATVTMLPGGEIVPSMETGVLDAFEWSNLAMGEKMGFHEVTKYFYFNPVKSSHGSFIILFSKSVWNSFPDDIKKQIALACRDCAYWSLSWTKAQDVLMFKKAQEKYKGKIRMLPRDMMEEFNDIAEGYYTELADKYPGVDRVLSSWDSFKKDYDPYVGYLKYLDTTGGYFGFKTPYSERKKK